MFKKSPKTVSNALLHLSLPNNFRKSLVGMDTELTIIETFDGQYYPAVLTFRLVSKEEIHVMQGAHLQQQYLQWVTPPEGTTVTLKEGLVYAGYKGLGLQFDKQAIEHPSYVEAIGQGRILQAFHSCWDFHPNFYMDLVAHYDARQMAQIDSLIETILATVQLKKDATLERYQQLVAQEEAESKQFIEECQQEKANKEAFKKRCDQFIQQHSLQNVVFDLTDEGGGFTAAINSLERMYTLQITIEEMDQAQMIFEEAAYLLPHLTTIHQKSKKAIVEQFLDLYNTSWTDTTINKLPLSSQQFLEQLLVPFISINSHDICLSYSTKDDLFCGHGLLVEYAYGSHLEDVSISLFG